MCKPKSLGGLGIRNIIMKNKFYLENELGVTHWKMEVSSILLL